MKPEFSVIIPCYNEEKAVELTVSSIKKHLENERNYEIIIVNDGSTDRTNEVLENIAQNDPMLRILKHQVNRGYGAALKTGIRNASGELIIITDADGSYPNYRFPELLQVARNADMVVGARTAHDANYPFIRKIPKIFLNFYAEWLTDQRIPDLNSGMRVFRRSLIEKFINILPDGFSFTTTITLALLINNYDVQFLPIGYHQRIGKSKIRPIRDTINFFLLILRTGTYFAPLRVFLPLSGILSLLFMLSLSYDVFILKNLTDKSILLLLFAMNTALFALLADMIDKRSGK